MTATNRIVRPLAVLLTLGLLAAILIPFATSSTQASPQTIDSLQAGPVVTGLNGVKDGDTLAGTVNIEALVSGSVARVEFKLTGPKPDTHTEQVRPYFFKGDHNGAPYGWNTTQSPDGDYTMTTTAYDSANRSGGPKVVRFRIGNSRPAPTATPVPTPAPSTGVCGESMTAWHPPVVNGCATGHEHGDAPPAWITQAGYTPSFHGAFNTSAKENTDKHAAMKGFSTRMSGVDIYFRVHAASNVLDRSARYHSYEVWARDASGAVSHWQGWYNTGDPETERFPRRQGVEILTRPVMLVVDQTSYNQGIRCEQWYANTAIWSWDFGWTICNTTTLYYAGENQQQDRSFWKIAPDNSLGGTRRLEAAWYSSRQHPTGAFVTTQFGDIMSGMNDVRCAGTTTKFGVTYQNICLQQYIAPTMTQVAFPDNAVQKTFDVSGVKLPN